MDELLELYETMGISPAVYAYGERTLEKLKDRFAAIDQVAEHNQAKVLWAMQKNRVSADCFAGTIGQWRSPGNSDAADPGTALLRSER